MRVVVPLGTLTISVAFCSPAKKTAFSGLMENPLVGKKLVLTSKPKAPKQWWSENRAKGSSLQPSNLGLTMAHNGAHVKRTAISPVAHAVRRPGSPFGWFCAGEHPVVLESHG